MYVINLDLISLNVCGRGSYFQVGNEVKMNMTVEDAYQRTLETVLDWISAHVNMSKSQVYFRSFAPVHFR